jgi:hypothetical protein
MNPKQLLLDLAELLNKEPKPDTPLEHEPWKRIIEENTTAGRVIEKEKLVEKVSKIPIKPLVSSSSSRLPSPPSSPVNEPSYEPVETQEPSPPSSPEPPKRLTINISAAVLQQSNPNSAVSVPPKRSAASTVPKKDLSVRQRIAKKLGVKLKKF